MIGNEDFDQPPFETKLMEQTNEVNNKAIGMQGVYEK